MEIQGEARVVAAVWDAIGAECTLTIGVTCIFSRNTLSPVPDAHADGAAANYYYYYYCSGNNNNNNNNNSSSNGGGGGSSSSSSSTLLLLLQSALQPLVGFGLLYDFVPQSSIFTLLSPVSHFHLL